MPQLRILFAYLEGDAKFASVLRIAISVIFVLIVWQLLATYVVTNKMLLVSPGKVVIALLHEARTGALAKNSIATISAVAVSFPIAVAIGILIGLILASNRLFSLTVGPVMTAMYSVPVVALAPLFIAWLGLGFASKFVVVTLVSVFPVLVTTEAGLKATDHHLLEAAKAFNASKLQIFTTVMLPFALPFIVSGVRVAWARALVGIIVAEFFGSFAGYGFAILAAEQTFNTAVLLAYVILLGILGLVGSLFFGWLEHKLAPWRHE